MVKTVRGEKRMTRVVTIEEKLLQKRKFYIRSLIIFTVLLLFAFNLGSWLFLKQMDSYLENELEKRLTSIARLADRIILNNYIKYPAVNFLESILVHAAKSYALRLV